MPKYVIGTVEQIPPGNRKLVEIRGRQIVIFNLNGDFFGILDRCPHQGASLCKGQIVGLVESEEPGEYKFSRQNEIIRCPWHGWEFDIRTGRSRCEPSKIRATQYPVTVNDKDQLTDGEYITETFDVDVEGQYLVITV